MRFLPAGWRVALSGMILAAVSPSAPATEIIAHRGSSRLYPENTLAAAKAAWREGADAVEIDVRLTRDARIVLMHDASLLRTGGRDRPVADFTHVELQELDVGSWKGPEHAGERVPLLEELLATVPEGRKLYVEIKCGPEIVPPLQALIESSAPGSAKLVFISFDQAVCAAVKIALPAHPVLWIVGEPAKAPSGETLVEVCRTSGFDGLDLRADWPIDERFVRTVHAAGLALCVWTVDDPVLAARLIQAGVDGVTTNRPGSLRAALAAAAESGN